MATENKEDKDKELKLIEQPDGSLLVGGDEPPPEDDKEKKVEGKSEDNEDDVRLGKGNEDDDESSEEQGHDNETEEEREARRQRNRQRRAENKQNRKNYVESLKRELAARDELLQQAMQRLDAVERRTQGADMAMVESEFNKAAEAYNYYKAVHADAVTNGKGQEAVEAFERMQAAAERAKQLQGIKEAAKSRTEPAPPLDPRLKMHAESWLENNKWYDPECRDQDSQIARTIDRELHRTGWDPTTEQYWQEFDSRLKKYLPHRYSAGYNSDKRGNGNAAPRAPVGGSGRDGSGKGSGYILSPERVQAIKDAGMWDDLAARNRMIKRYQDQDKQQGAQ